MPIRFLCIHCKKVVSVKDEVAGKKGKCPHCQKIITVPVPRPPAAEPPRAAAPPGPPKAEPPKKTPPPAPTDLDSAAAAFLGDDPKPEKAAPATIDFTCPMCDAQVHMPLAEAGKRAPCPECRRIIKVPEPEKRDPANWRQTGPTLPSAARRPDEPAPEGAWGSAAAAASVSREALQDAGAIPEARAFLTVRQRIVRYTLWSAGAVAVLTLLAAGYLKFTETRAEQGVEAAVAYADGDAGKKDLGPAGRAALHLLAAEYCLKSRQSGSAEKAHAEFRKCFNAAREAAGASPTEHDALMQELAAAELALGGTDQEADAKAKVRWDDIQNEARSALAEIRVQSDEAKLQGLREAARRLAEAGQPERATALAHSLYSAAGTEQAQALGIVGLELLAAKQQHAAEDILDKWTRENPNGKDRPAALAPAMVALAVALGRQPPEPSGRGSKHAVADDRAILLGTAEGQARSGHAEAAGQIAADVARKYPDLPIQIRVAAAAAELDAKAPGHAEADQALADAQQAQGASPWLLLRLARIGARAGASPDAIRATAGLIQDPALRGRAQLAALEAQLAQAKQAADVQVIDTVEAQTVAARLAHAEWARRTPGASGVVKGWNDADRAFGQLGIALGKQGD